MGALSTPLLDGPAMGPIGSHLSLGLTWYSTRSILSRPWLVPDLHYAHVVAIICGKSEGEGMHE